MSVSANRHNIATPQSSFANLASSVEPNYTAKPFTLHFNKLDGSHFPVATAQGWWDNVLSTASGSISPAAMLTCEVAEQLHTVHVLGYAPEGVYPVDFDVSFYKDGSVVYSKQVRGNTKLDYVYHVPSLHIFDKYTVTIHKINKASSVAKVANVFCRHEVARADLIKPKFTIADSLSKFRSVRAYDTIRPSVGARAKHWHTNKSADSLNLSELTNSAINSTIKMSDRLSPSELTVTSVDNTLTSLIRLAVRDANSCHIESTSTVTDIVEPRERTQSFGEFTSFVQDKVLPVVSANSDGLMNVHIAMQQPNRKVYGKIEVTYNNPFAYNKLSITGASTYNRPLETISDGERDDGIRYFSLIDNNLLGTMPLQTNKSRVAWHGQELSKTDGTFETAQVVSLSFETVLLRNLVIYGDSAYANYPVTFVVELLANGVVHHTFNVVDNDNLSYTVFNEPIANIDTIRITVSKISVGNMPLAISEIPIFSTIKYAGDTLMSIDVLEELTYKDEAMSLGGVSANELTVYISNENSSFFFGNDPDAIRAHLKKNRKVEAWLGTDLHGTLEWYKLGTYWTHTWDVPVGKLHVKTVAFDTLGLLNTMPYTDHRVVRNKSLYDLFKTILDRAKSELDFITYNIDERLKQQVIPVAWFLRASYMSNLNRLAQCAYVNVFCDRDGTIQVLTQKYVYDVWHTTMSSDTNVKTLSYPTRYTVMPNSISVDVAKVTTEASVEVLNDTSTFTVSGSMEITYPFSNVVEQVSRVEVSKTDGVLLDYDWFSWGIICRFSGAGTVSGCIVTGSTITTSKQSTYTLTDKASIQANGIEQRLIESDFIQTTDHAASLAEEAKEDTNRNVYNADVTYTGDIALSLNDYVWLKNGISPLSHYMVKRHTLSWNGGLSGTATINT